MDYLMDEYGQESVLSAIENLHLVLAMNYMRDGLEIHLEPDAFFRLMYDLERKSQTTPVNQNDLKTVWFTINTPAGPLKIVKNEDLDQACRGPKITTLE